MGIKIPVKVMPFGLHKGRALDDVPAKYLDWLRKQTWIDKWKEVHAYLKENKNSIDMALEAEAEMEMDMLGDYADTF